MLYMKNEWATAQPCKGFFGVRFNGEDRLAWNEDGSEPSKLGKAVIRLCRLPESDLSFWLETMSGEFRYGGELPTYSYMEWGYIVNLDTHKLEVYEGLQLESDPTNRFGSEPMDEDGCFYPCKMVQEIPLDFLASCDEQWTEKWAETLEREEDNLTSSDPESSFAEELAQLPED